MAATHSDSASRGRSTGREGQDYSRCVSPDAQRVDQRVQPEIKSHAPIGIVDGRRGTSSGRAARDGRGGRGTVGKDASPSSDTTCMNGWASTRSNLAVMAELLLRGEQTDRGTSRPRLAHGTDSRPERNVPDPRVTGAEATGGHAHSSRARPGRHTQPLHARAAGRTKDHFASGHHTLEPDTPRATKCSRRQAFRPSNSRRWRPKSLNCAPKSRTCATNLRRTAMRAEQHGYSRGILRCGTTAGWDGHGGCAGPRER